MTASLTAGPQELPLIDASSDARRSHLFHADPNGFTIELFDKADSGAADARIAHLGSGAWLAFRLEGTAGTRQVSRARAQAAVGDVTAIWTSYSDRLKEDLLVRSRPAADQVTFRVSQHGLNIAPDRSGGYFARDWRGITRFHVLAPTVHDALGRSGSVTLDLNETRWVLHLDATFAGTATYPLTIDPTVTYSGADIVSGTPATTTYGSLVKMAWDGITGATASDWVGLYAVGAPAEPRGTWDYVNCTLTPTIAVPSGSCTFTMPSSSGTFEFRLFGNDTDTLLAVSNPIAVSATASTWTTVYGPQNFTMDSGGCCPTPNQMVPIMAGASEWRLTITQTYGNGNTMNFSLGCGSPEINLVTVQGGAWAQQQDLSGLIPAACQGQSLHLVGWCPFGYWGGTFNLFTRSGPPRPPVPTSGYGAAVAGDGPVAYWRFNETGGFHAADLTQNQNDVQAMTGATLGGLGVLPADTTERAASLDGNWGNLKAWNSSSLQNLSAVTVEVWMSVSGVPGNGFSTLVAKHSTADRGPYGFTFSTPGGQGGYALGFQDTAVNGSGVLRWNVNGTDLDALPNFQLNTPYHIVATADASGMRLYVNGGLVATGGGATLSFSDQPLYFGLDGGQLYTSWSPFRGSIGEVAIYNKVLSVDQMRTHYQVGSGCPSAPNASTYSSAVLGDTPAGYWRLGDQCGYGIADASPTHNHGGRTGFVSTAAQGLLSGDTDGARSFAGNTTSYALVAPSSSLAPTAGLSVETWMQISGVPGNGWSTVIAKHSTADRGPYGFTFSTPGGQGGYALGFQDTAVNGSGVLRWNVNGTDLDALPNFQLNTPYHIVATADASGMRLYLNGELVASGAPASLSFAADQPLYFGLDGGQLYTPWSPFQGTLDEAAIYAAALNPNQIAAHYWIGKGDPQPLVHMTAPATATSVTSPVTVSWAPLPGVDPAEIKTYTVSYGIGEASPATLATLTRDPGGTLPTSISVYVGDNTQYRFNVEATTYTGKLSGQVGQSGWVSTHTALPPFSGSGADEDPDLFDQAGGGIACIPSTDARQLVYDLLLQQDLCNAQPSQVVWQQAPPPLDGYVCPGNQQPFVPPAPGLALLSMTNRACVVRGPGVVTATQGGSNDINAQYKAARDKISSALASKGYSSLIAAAVLDGVGKIEKLIESAIANGNYPRAWAYVRQLQRIAAFVDELPKDGLQGVEVTVSTGRIPDAVVRIADATNLTITRTILLEVKSWPASMLSNANAMTKLADQLRDMIAAGEYDGVLVEFVERDADGISDKSQVTNALAGTALDGAHLDIEVVNVMDAATKIFSAIGHLL